MKGTCTHVPAAAIRNNSLISGDEHCQKTVWTVACFCMVRALWSKITGNLAERICLWQEPWKLETVQYSGRWTGSSLLEPFIYIPMGCTHFRSFSFLPREDLFTFQSSFSPLLEGPLSSSNINSETHNFRTALLCAEPAFAHTTSSWGIRTWKPRLRSPLST